MNKHVHFLGICGYAVSGAALVAQQLGYTVTGSDENAHPPTTDILSRAGIPWANEHTVSNFLRFHVPDLIVVGNSVRKDNVEWTYAVELGIPCVSESEFYYELTKDRLRLTICGTHGKTTTASLLAYMLDNCGLSPGFRFGAMSRDFGSTARLGSGSPFVFEGDEYGTAPWDSSAKFLHTHPAAACITRIDWDHPDMYPTPDAYEKPFIALVQQLPADGMLAICVDDERCVAVSHHAACSVISYGTGAQASWRVRNYRELTDAQEFTLSRAGHPDCTVHLSLPGIHNALNAAAALILAQFAGADFDTCVAACATFQGPSRRFHISGTADGITVVDDHADHPTEAGATLHAARLRFPGRRIIGVFVPHTYSRTATFIDDFARNFTDADVVVLGPIEAARERGAGATVSSETIAEKIRQSGKEVTMTSDSADALHALRALARQSDVIVCMSVGGFDDLAQRLIDAIRSES